MKNKLTYLITVIFLFVSSSLAGQLVIDIDQAVELAIENNLSIKSEQIGLDIKKRIQDTTWNYFIPSLSVGSTLSKMNEVPEASSMEFEMPPPIPGMDPTVISFEMPGGDDYWDLTFSLRASLTLTASMFVGIRQAMLDYEAGLINMQMAEKKLALNTRKAFYNLLLFKENMDLMEQSITAAQDRYEQAYTNYYNGLVSEYDMLSAKVALENMKPGLEEMKIGYQTALMSFKQMLGLAIDEQVTLDGSIQMEELEFNTAKAKEYISKRLDIRMFIKNIEILENIKLLSLMSFSPMLTFSFSMDPTFQNDPFEDDLFEDVDENWSQRGGMFSITLTLPLDGLFPLSKTQVDIWNKHDTIEQAHINFKQVTQAAELEIESIIMRLEKSVKSINTLKLNVELAERAYNMAEEAYNVGSRDLLSLQNAELELNRAKLEVQKEEYNYVIGLLDLEYAINTDLTEVGN